jgi:two-component system, chemotaxis family, chemotaxis protein CheY
MNGKHLVIIIEDDFDMYNMFKMVAELVPDYEIEVITDGIEALKRIDNPLLPNLVLLDLHLPYVEGDEFLRSARANPIWKNVPIYIITADAKLAKDYQRDPRGANGVYLKGDYYIDLLQELLEKYAQS